MNLNKKSSIVLVLKILEEYSDEDHYLTQGQIVKKIKDIYNIDIERKSIGSSLKLLSELDYDINKGNNGGFALLSRTFDYTEANYIIDAIFSSKSISGEEAKKIISGVSSSFSRYHRNDYSYIYKTSDISRTKNKQVMYNIYIINEAIKSGKRIGFQYLSYDKNDKQIVKREGYQYIVSPYFLINNFGRYYLLCNFREKYRPLQNFRVDYMKNIELKNDLKYKPISELKNVPMDFSITQYVNEHIYMANGETIISEIELENEDYITFVKDWFGENALITNKDNKIIAKIKCNEQALYYWVMQYSDFVKAISPSLFVNRVKEGLAKALGKYK